MNGWLDWLATWMRAATYCRPSPAAGFAPPAAWNAASPVRTSATVICHGPAVAVSPIGLVAGSWARLTDAPLTAIRAVTMTNQRADPLIGRVKTRSIWGNAPGVDNLI
jgi:hypothetical protein